MKSKNQISTVKKNTYFISIGQAIHMALSFILVPIAARWLGEDGFGKYTLGMTISYFVLMINDLGMNTYITREISKINKNADRFLVNALIVKLFSVILVVTFLLLLLTFCNYSPDTKAVIIVLSVYGVLSSFVQLTTGTFRAFEKMQYEMIIVALEKFITTSIAIFLLTKGFGLVSFAGTFIIGGSISVILGFVIVKKKFVPLDSSFDKQFCKDLVVKSLPFGASMFLITIYDKIDIVMLSFMQTMSDIGWYSSAYRLLAVTSVIPTILVTAVFPKMSKEVVSGENKLAHLYTKCFKYLFFIMVPFIALGVLIGDKIVLFVFGDNFFNAILAFQILVWAAGIIFLNILLGTLFRASDRQKKLVFFQFWGVIINLTLNFILIPIYSYIGAAIATVITEGILFIVYFRFITKWVCRLTEMKFVFQTLGAVLLMSLFVVTFRSANLLIVLFTAGIIYFGILYLMKAYTLKEILLVSQNSDIDN